ncbi:MAG TPA: hypothetical protein VFR07_06275 [Mycobacteriales bacterium]|jgi:hypothetical protein|nr:hypothetical protein [Mycobacteriales bacterium]
MPPVRSLIPVSTAGLLAAAVLGLPAPAVASPAVPVPVSVPVSLSVSGPVQVSVPDRAVLATGGRVRVAPTVRCARGYRLYELYVQVSQAQGADRAQAYRVPAVRCDGVARRVPVVVPTVSGRLRPGPARIEALLLLTSGTGPPALARDSGPATLVRAG